MREPFLFPRVQAIPGIRRASLCIDGIERVGYDFGVGETRPFFFPLIGATGRMLTRMGHPKPVGHEHHKSVWFGHQFVNGINFWEERPGTEVQVRHRRVVLYQDGADWAGFVADLDWWAEGKTLLTQRLTAAIEPQEDGGFALDLQTRFEAPNGPVELGKTNFGFLGVRVAKTISERFGGGRLLNSEGATGEPAIFGKPARWVDYSGPSAPDQVEGIAYFDHPDNPKHPTAWHAWHVRADGWMEAAVTFAASIGIADGHPLDLRYRLLAHVGAAEPEAIERAWKRFATMPPYVQRIGEGRMPTLVRGLES